MSTPSPANTVDAPKLQKLLDAARAMARDYIPPAGYGGMDIVSEAWDRAGVDSECHYFDLTNDQVGEIIDAYRQGKSQ